MAGLCAPLSTLRQHPRRCRRMTRGQCGSLDLHCERLALSTPCRSSRRTAFLVYMLPPLPRCSGWAYSSLVHPAVSAFPERGIGSACTSSFSRTARRSLTLRPAHSRGHLFVTRYPKASDTSSPPCLLRLLPAGAVAGWGSHPLENAALSRRTPVTAILRRRDRRRHNYRTV